MRGDRYTCPRCTDEMALRFAVTHERICDAFPAAMAVDVAVRQARASNGCENCDGRRCMACVVREVHDDGCVHDCPTCCGQGLLS